MTSGPGSFATGERGALLVIATGLIALSTPTATQVVWLIAVVVGVALGRVGRSAGEAAPGTATG